MQLQEVQEYLPVAAENLQVEPTGSESVVFDPATNAFHLLNGTASTILGACNGASSVRDIAVKLRLQDDAPDVDAVVEDVRRCLGELRALGLIEYITEEMEGDAPPPSGYDKGVLTAVNIMSSSMFPILLAGDRVLVRRTPVEDLQPGDIIIYYKPSLQRYTAHRIQSIQKDSQPPVVITRGDQCHEVDPPVRTDCILGTAVAVFRDGGFQWLRSLQAQLAEAPSAEAARPEPQACEPRPDSGASFRDLQVLDLRQVPPESIRAIEHVEDVGVVLLSPRTAEAWSPRTVRDVKNVVTVDDDVLVCTGQPELLPEMIPFLEAPLRLVVVGQLFLTEFSAAQIPMVLRQAKLYGDAYVGSSQAKAALETVAELFEGGIRVVPAAHRRWIGESILGPEYASAAPEPLVAVGKLDKSARLGSLPDTPWLYN
jgi:hypothetical protein